MNNGPEILRKQNLEGNIDKLLAQRRLYSKAKTLQFLLILSAVIVPIAASLTLKCFDLNNDTTNWLVGLYLSIIIFGEKILEFKINKNKKIAASIQEKFDTSLFGIPENIMLNAVSVDYDIINRYSKKSKKNKDKVERVRNWYSKQINKLETNVAVLLCQRMNISYDQNIKIKYNVLLVSLSIITLGGLFAIAFKNDISIKVFFVEVLLPSYPIINYTYNEVKRNREVIDNLNNIKEKIEPIIDSATVKDIIPVVKLRKIQDQIYFNRANGPLIPDWIYNRFWGRLEDEMNYSVKHRIEEIIEKTE